jgi:hypothetical protein
MHDSLGCHPGQAWGDALREIEAASGTPDTVDDHGSEWSTILRSEPFIPIHQLSAVSNARRNGLQ